MHELWFWLVAVMVAIYAVLDGFDFGAGALHLFVARTDAERRTVLQAIGPWWDGNEVWLLAAGGSLFLAFPKVLASAFSGLYLALFLVLWTLIVRGASLEFRSHVRDPMWRRFFDVAFAVASTLLAILFGTALGNLLRGVPLDRYGHFALPLFPNEGVPGIVDTYTAFVGVTALIAVALHGALFLAWKTTDAVHVRSVRAARILMPILTIMWIVATLATRAVNPGLFALISERPSAWIGLAIALIGFGSAWFGLRRGAHRLAFAGSSLWCLALLATTAACTWPVMLRSSLDPAWSLTAENAGTDVASLRTGLVWWFIGFPLVIAWFAWIAYVHRGKVKLAPEGEGY